MTLQEAVKVRVSRRNFNLRTIEEQKIQKIADTLAYINENSQLNCEFVKDGSEAFKKFRVTYGFFKNIKSLIILKGDEKIEHLDEKAGYFGELLVLSTVAMGLSTCWIGAMFDKGSLNIPQNERVVCVIAVGYSDEVTVKEKIIHRLTRLRAQKPILIGENAPQWAKDGEELAQLAPTAKNRRGVRFIWGGEKITAHDKSGGAFSLVDLGIVKFHFELGAKGKFEYGNGARFTKE